MSELKHLFEGYKTAVLEKDERAFLDLYHPEFIGFDLWQDWVKTPESWRTMVREWFSSLQSDQVRVAFSDIREVVGQDVATAHAMVRYTGVSSGGEYLRHLDNRLTWIARKENGVWKIIHEHTSAPVDHQTGKASLRRG